MRDFVFENKTKVCQHDQGDRSLIFYFERGRDSGVKATSVFRLARARRSRARQSPKDPIRHIAWSDGFHYLTHLQTLFGNQQMDMIGHQAIGVDVTRNRWHHFDESPVVFGIIKNVLTVNTAQHHMIDACSAWFSWLSWHNTKFKDYTKTLQRYNLLWEFTNFLEKKINESVPLIL